MAFLQSILQMSKYIVKSFRFNIKIPHGAKAEYTSSLERHVSTCLKNSEKYISLNTLTVKFSEYFFEVYY